MVLDADADPIEALAQRLRVKLDARREPDVTLMWGMRDPLRRLAEVRAFQHADPARVVALHRQLIGDEDDKNLWINNATTNEWPSEYARALLELSHAVTQLSAMDVWRKFPEAGHLFSVQIGNVYGLRETLRFMSGASHDGRPNALQEFLEVVADHEELRSSRAEEVVEDFLPLRDVTNPVEVLEELRAVRNLVKLAGSDPVALAVVLERAEDRDAALVLSTLAFVRRDGRHCFRDFLRADGAWRLAVPMIDLKFLNPGAAHEVMDNESSELVHAVMSSDHLAIDPVYTRPLPAAHEWDLAAGFFPLPEISPGSAIS